MEVGLVATLLVILLVAGLGQSLLWRRWPQYLLHNSFVGRLVLRMVPWRSRRLAAAAYGRASARDPIFSLAIAGTLALLASSGLIFFIRLKPSSAYDPWAYLDARTSPVATRARHTRATLGEPPHTLWVLAAPCDERSICDGSLLQPLIRVHNTVIEATGELGDEGDAADARSYPDVCRRRPDAGRGAPRRCAAESVLTLANPAAVDSTARIDGATRLWIPAGGGDGGRAKGGDGGGDGGGASPGSVISGPAAPYEALLRQLVLPAFSARGQSAAVASHRDAPSSSSSSPSS